jgi:rhodanese-related sulfurtransferase
LTKKRRTGGSSPSTTPPSAAARSSRSTGRAVAPPNRARLYLAIGGAIGAVAILIAGVVLLGGLLGSSSAGGVSGETVVQGNGGKWINVTPDRLSRMLEFKDFTFINVKTPYIGEIDRTDLYLPYDQLTARASELPQAKDAKIVIYCRTGTTSAIAAQTLVDLGYTNIWNLDGGMVAWEASGRKLVQKNR